MSADVDTGEQRIRAAVPHATTSYLEPDLDTSGAVATPSANGGPTGPVPADDRP